MGTFTSRIIIVTLLFLLGVTMCSATRSLLFPYPYEGSHGGYGGGYGGLGGGYGGYGGGYGGYGGPYIPRFGGGYGGGYGGIKDVHVGAGAGSGNEHEDKIGDFHVGGKHNIKKGNDYGVGYGVSGEAAKKGPDGLAEGLGFGVRGQEEKGGIGEGIGYHEGGEKGSQFGGLGFGRGCGPKSEVVKPGTTP